MAAMGEFQGQLQTPAGQKEIKCLSHICQKMS